MKIKDFLFRSERAATSVPAPSNSTGNSRSGGHLGAAPGHSADNVIQMPVTHTRYEPSPTARESKPISSQLIPPPRFQGLLNTPELAALFAENYFGYGRHAGSHFRSHEVLELGLQELTAKFQNQICEMIGRRQAKHDAMSRQIREIEPASPAMGSQLTLACIHVEREISQLREQIQLADQRKGWVLDPINRYRAGFNHGLRAAIDFDSLGTC